MTSIHEAANGTGLKRADSHPAAARVSVTSPAPRDAWRALVQADEEALVFQTPGWTDAICALGSYTDASRLYEFEDGRRLLLPLVRRKGLPAGLFTQASMPNSWGMGGPVAPGGLRAEEAAAIFQDLANSGVLRTSIRPNPLFAAAWAAGIPQGVARIPRLAHVLDLEGGFNRVWSERFASETRTAVRKAEKSGLVVECDTTGRLLPEFFQMFDKSVARWAGMQHEPRWLARLRASQRDTQPKFEAIARSIGEAFRLWVAFKDGRPAAAILVLRGKNASYTRGAMDKELAGPTRANQLLHRLAIEDACLYGCRRYHMGESGESSSLAQFKTRLGAVAVEYAEYSIERFPITAMDHGLRSFVKRIIGFKDMK